MLMIRNLCKFIALGLILLLFYSCNRVEGCTDPLAENFDAAADRDCCCTYYQLSLSVDHHLDTLDFNYFTAYPDANNDSFELREMGFLCSKFELIKADGSSFGVNDSINLRLVDGSTLDFRDDFTALRPGTFVHNVGDFLEFGDYTKIRFLLGLEAPATLVEATSIDNPAQPLSNQHSPSFYTGTDYQHAFFEVILPDLADTIRFEVQDTFWIELDYNISAVDGADANIPLAIDYANIFNGISFINDDSATVVQKIQNNIHAAFSIQ